GLWDRSESYFNEAERLDPRNVNLLTQHAISYKGLRRFPEALRKLDQVLNITPDEVDIVAGKANIAQAEGDLPRAAVLLAPLHPNADDTFALETQAYQAILERRPAQIIPRLKEILAKPDPALGYNKGEPARAIAALQKLLSIPYSGVLTTPLTPALLRLDPMFDPLRNDPRFQKLVASPTPEKR